ncbi:kelch-like protein 31 [Stylophora pistillata]|uniref:kelch-like protein 31 n=1 Tax=Stylophora pistillata TaxID=50429 RepID=UPI000C0509BB|nr:kelch-like protein 31 [Stylophora pistillata]
MKGYNVEKYAWGTLHTSHGQCRKNACVVAAGSRLYMLVGRNQVTWDYSEKAERFDTVGNKWEEIADMLQERSQAFGVASRGKIFVAGGTGWTGDVQTCETYTTSTNEWQYVANFSVPRSCGSMFDLLPLAIVMACVKLVMDAITKMATFSDEDDLSKSPRKGYDARVVTARGGMYTFCYLPEEDLWKRLPDGLRDINASSTQMIKFRDQLFAFSGYQKSERYDPLFNAWSQLNFNISYAKVAVLKGEIYAVQVDTFRRKTATKRYNVKQYTWETLH